MKLGIILVFYIPLRGGIVGIQVQQTFPSITETETRTNIGCREITETQFQIIPQAQVNIAVLLQCHGLQGHGPVTVEEILRWYIISKRRPGGVGILL